MLGKRKIKIQIRKWFPLAIVMGFGVLVLSIFFSWPKADYFAGIPKDIFLSDNGLEFSFRGVTEKTVGEFLMVHHLTLGGKETAFPVSETALTPGMRIFVVRTHEVVVQADGKRQSYQVQARSVGEALAESGITLDEDDIVKPDRGAVAERGLTIVITRVVIEEQTVDKIVAFEKKANEDDKLSWRKTVVTQKGEKGLDRLVYRVSTHDGKEVNRKLLRTERAKEPVTEIVTQGTYVKLGKKHSGGASWYAWTGTMAAANPWLPKGSYVKVTNTENGKSVIVVINDRGPFVPGRIIDLDKVAFAKIASVGAGVIYVKMEEIIN
ncbi:MAG: RlpA-like double-psi beta-barrel domain-containing protein [Candidatus Moranbacteria bacterium]|nr:RlpA-like double-psi beta-barrel domain-containing protein [Candidatus Moranbacteria bacterium]